MFYDHKTSGKFRSCTLLFKFHDKPSSEILSCGQFLVLIAFTEENVASQNIYNIENDNISFMNFFEILKYNVIEVSKRMHFLY